MSETLGSLPSEKWKNRQNRIMMPKATIQPPWITRKILCTNTSCGLGKCLSWRSACCTGMGPWVWIPSSHVKSQAWWHVFVTSVRDGKRPIQVASYSFFISTFWSQKSVPMFLETSLLSAFDWWDWCCNFSCFFLPQCPVHCWAGNLIWFNSLSPLRTSVGKCLLCGISQKWNICQRYNDEADG